MSIITLLIVFIVIDVIFYFVEQIPMAAPFPTVIKIVGIVVALLVVLQFFGLIGGTPLNI